MVHNAEVLGGMMEPVNCTHMHISWYNNATDKGGTIHEDVFYKDHPNYEHMPPVTQAPETKAEHAAWWAWYEAAGGTTVEINEKG